MKTFMAKAESVDRRWLLVDAEGQTLGRLATQIATFCVANIKPNTHLMSTLVILL